MSRRERLLGNTIMRTLLSVWGWFALGVLLIIWVPTVAVVRLVTAPFDPGRYWAGYTFRKIAVVHGWLNPMWRFRTSGTMITDPRRPYVVVSNHESFADMFLLSHLKWEMKYLAKKDFFQYPLAGWLLRLAGDIRLVRGNKDSIINAMEQCSDRLGKKTCVMIFPEGTRTRSGELGAFKDGAFRLAIESQTAVLPVVVHGTYKAITSGDWRFGVCDAEARVLAPIDTAGMTLDDVDSLRDRVRTMIADELAVMTAAAGDGPITS